MAKIVMLILAVGAVSTLGGCRYWYQEGASFDECKQDRYDCLCQLEKYSDMSSIGGYETGFMKDCMRSKGYRLAGQSSLPCDVRREAPHMTTFWLLAGVSGTLEPGQ